VLIYQGKKAKSSWMKKAICKKCKLQIRISW